MDATNEEVSGARNGLARTIYLATFLGTVAWLGAIVLAPYLRSRGHGAAASFLYALFAPVCHQIPGRSFRLAGFPLAVCGRCLGIYVGFLAGLLGYPWIDRLTSKRSLGTGPRRYGLPKPRVFLAFSLPIGLDFAAGLIGLWDSTNAVRFATGAAWGALLPFYFLPGVVGLFARRAGGGARPPGAGLDNRAAKS